MFNKQHNTGNKNVGTTKELPTVISFCSGYGGIERGIELAGVEHRVIAYVEIEAFAIANLVAKMESGQLDPAPIWTDLKTFPAHLFRGAVDIITGGYPCQPFSAAGQRKGEDDPRHLWPTIREHIETIRPDKCFFENVEGHISLGLSTVISDLEEDGFRTAFGIFSAREVGAPHQRKRVYIMGNTKHYGPSTPEKRRSVEATSSDNKKGQVKTIESTRTSEPRSCGNLQRNKLSNTKGERLQGRPISKSIDGQRKKPNGEQSTRCHQLYAQDWPARPDQKQHQWEFSRVKPQLGGKSHGYSNRVDRIRLLGNGVVPQTAAKAWLILTEQV